MWSATEPAPGTRSDFWESNIVTMHLCHADDMHPYKCLGPGKCIHCDRRRLSWHNPTMCWLCHETKQRHGPKCQLCIRKSQEEDLEWACKEHERLTRIKKRALDKKTKDAK